MPADMSRFLALVLVAAVVINVVNPSQVLTFVTERIDCPPYEESKDVDFICPDNHARKTLVWRHNGFQIAWCNSTNCSSNYQVVRTNRTSVLYLSNLDRKAPSYEGLWSCGYVNAYDSSYQELYHCNLTIYHAPEKLKCDTPGLTRQGRQVFVFVNCSAFNLYPQAKCTFFRRADLGDDEELQSSTYVTPIAKNDPVYYNTNCGLLYPIREDLVGHLIFYLQLSFDSYRSYTSNKVSIEIDAPKAKLLDNCFSVREDNVFWPNETIHCTCEIRDIDNSTMDVHWIEVNSPRTNHYSSTLNINYDDKDKTFMCIGTSSLGKIYNITYTPLFAYAAEVLHFTANGERDLNVENATVVEFNCEVDSKPRGTVYITDSSGQRLDDTSKLLTCDDTGTYTCQAFNEIFPNDISRQYVHVTVKCNHWLGLINTGSKSHQVYADSGTNFSIEFELSMGNTDIAMYTVMKDGMQKKLKARKDKPSASGRYLIEFTPLSETHYKITLNIFDIQSSDFGSYTFKICDEDDDEVVDAFVIKEINAEAEWYSYSYLAMAITIGLSMIVLCLVYLKCTKRNHANIRADKGMMSNGKNVFTDSTNSTITNQDIRDRPQTQPQSYPEAHVVNSSCTTIYEPTEEQHTEPKCFVST
ncbi:uncharacterized protein LOC131926994 isoform X2 [Physella acuta]|uniref:uncharacterized protein LOC131926994 isoform X2 n=1 Tax=Physella acuta TaxID=109671 RepID=UPI0027DAD993|nr:uncharacterized protein LOC131926994 isoform X2 [Physella acuta]